MTAPRSAQAGFTLIEVLITVVLVGILVSALSVGLTSMVSSTGTQEEIAAFANAARGKMEEVIASGFDNIPLSSPPGAPEPTLSDQVTIQGQLVSRTVVVDLADGDLPPDSIVDADFKQIIVEVGGFELHTFIAPAL